MCYHALKCSTEYIYTCNLIYMVLAGNTHTGTGTLHLIVIPNLNGINDNSFSKNHEYLSSWRVKWIYKCCLYYTDSYSHIYTHTSSIKKMPYSHPIHLKICSKFTLMFKISDFEHINKNFEWTHAINSLAENATNWKKIHADK